jgi:hypothetical protein
MGTLMPILKGKHLARLIIIEHVLVMVQLVRHLSVNLRCVLMRVLNVMILALMIAVSAFSVALSGSVTEAVSGSVSALHAFRPLRTVGGVSQRLSFFDALVHHHVALRLSLIVVEVLLLLIECQASRCSPILLVTVTLVLRSDHLRASFLTFLLGAKTRVEGLLLIVNWVKGVQNARIPIALYSNVNSY